jgi:hypothetical protein
MRVTEVWASAGTGANNVAANTIRPQKDKIFAQVFFMAECLFPAEV